MFDRKRPFDRQGDSEQNSTGYSERTVFSTDFGSPENSNFQNGMTGSAPQGGSYDGDRGGGDFSSARQSYDYGQSTTSPELPMVFASHRHEDIYVYEYKDRLEWYLRTPTGMLLIQTQPK